MIFACRLAILTALISFAALSAGMGRANAAVLPGCQAKLTPVSDRDPSTREDGVASNEINVTNIRRNAIVTAGDQQFVAYFYRNPDDENDPANNKVLVARRRLNSDRWDIFKTDFAAKNVEDCHDMISIAVDGDGTMHMAWGMHANPWRYVKSKAPVTGDGVIEFGEQQDFLIPGRKEPKITYPQFYNLPDGDLLLLYRVTLPAKYRDRPTDNYMLRYDVKNKEWSPVHDSPYLSGHATAGDPNTYDLHGAYPNHLAFDSRGNLHMSWCWRVTGAYQTNFDILYARSPDEGKTWTRMDGRPYALPLTQGHDGPQAGEVIVPIAQGSSLINHTGMTVDRDDRPVIATWWAPRHQEGDDTRQYMLVYYDGKSWQTSQITDDRPTETQTLDFGHDPDKFYAIASPLVVVDEENRILLLGKLRERGGGVTIAYSKDRKNWEFIDLTSENLGHWEPTYDPVLWQRENKLHLLYQPVGLGQAASPVSVLEWDARAYFDARKGEGDGKGSEP